MNPHVLLLTAGWLMLALGFLSASSQDSVGGWLVSSIRQTTKKSQITNSKKKKKKK